MSSPIERRKAQVDAIAGGSLAVEVSPIDARNRLLEHFEETGQKPLADAIRYGLLDYGEVVIGDGSPGGRKLFDTYWIDYPKKAE